MAAACGQVVPGVGSRRLLGDRSEVLGGDVLGFRGLYSVSSVDGFHGGLFFMASCISRSLGYCNTETAADAAVKIIS